VGLAAGDLFGRVLAMAATDEREAGHTVQEREELTPRKRYPLEEQRLRHPDELRDGSIPGH
jgi:hypothetical protein